MGSHAEPPWYFAGLAFECAQCGRCCAGPEEGYVWVDDTEAVEIAAFLGMTVDQFRRQYLRKAEGRYTIVEDRRSKDCAFLRPNGDGRGHGCAIYPVRPTQCRTWPFWSLNLQGPDAWARAGTHCAGINRGRRFSRDEIEQRSRITHE